MFLDTFDRKDTVNFSVLLRMDFSPPGQSAELLLRVQSKGLQRTFVWLYAESKKEAAIGYGLPLFDRLGQEFSSPKAIAS